MSSLIVLSYILVYSIENFGMAIVTGSIQTRIRDIIIIRVICG